MNYLITPQATDSLETWLSYLEKSHSKPIDMGLDRIYAVAKELAVLKPAPYVITVAGTNGKGSTCKLLEAVLLKMGLKVGVYSSPHLIHYNERIRIQGKSVSDEAIVRTFSDIEQRKSHSLTYFEFGTLTALSLFCQADLDVVILEVGLGGRLDATNIIDPNLAVITSIDIDHIEFLGDNREVIGYEKAGIFRPQIPVVIGEPDCPQSILNYAQQLECVVSRRGIDWDYRIENGQMYWYSEQCQWQLPLPKIPIPNSATVLAILQQSPFKPSVEILMQAMSETQMIGRFQPLVAQDFAKFSQNRPLAQVIIDVGHNPHAARYLATKLTELTPKPQTIYAVFSALVDKDITGIVEPLAEIIDQWHCAGLAGYRGQSGEDVVQKLTHTLPLAQAVAYPDVVAACQRVFEIANQNDVILVFGSFHTVADFMLWLER